MPSERRDRVALVTGGSRGIGRAIAQALALGQGERYAVGVLARSVDEVAGVAVDIVAAGGRALPLPGDVAEVADVQRAVARLAADFGPVAVLVANAGVIWPLGRSSDVDPDEWARALDINVSGVFRAVRAVLPGMLERGFGRIVTVTSGAASPPGMPSASAYSAGKAAVELLTQHLADEVAGSGVTANAVRPGTVDTPMQEFMRAMPETAVGERFHRRFHGLFQRGELLDPAVPGAFVARLVATELNGEVLDVREDAAWDRVGGRPRGHAGAPAAR